MTHKGTLPPEQPTQGAAGVADAASTAGAASATTARNAEEGAGTPSDEDIAKLLQKNPAEFISNLRKNGAVVLNVYMQQYGGVRLGDGTAIGGDAVWGDQHKRVAATTGDGGITAGRVLDLEMDKVRRVHVPAQGYMAAHTILERRRLVVLSGPPKGGKWTAALHMLSDLGAGEVFEISPASRADVLASGIAGTGRRGYVIDGWAPDGGSVSSFDLNRIADRLADTAAWMVVTVTSGDALSPDAAGLVVRWQDLPDHAAALDRHLEWHAGGDAVILDKARALAVNEVVRTPQEAAMQPFEIDQLAQLLCRAATGALRVEDIRAVFVRHATERAAAAFAENRDIERICLMIALAALDGAPYREVAAGAEHLHAKLDPNREPDPATTLFAQTRSERLRAIGARLVQGAPESGPVELIRYDNANLPLAILDHVWMEYDRLREPLLAWLDETLDRASHAAQLRAAGALGALARHDFDAVCRRVLKPLAISPKGDVRAAAAFALGIALGDDRVAPRVLDLLRDWSTGDTNWRLKWTAAVACGLHVGQRFPDEALRNLDRIARQGHLLLLEAVWLALSGILSDDDADAGYRVRALKDMESRARGERSVALQELIVFVLILGGGPSGRALVSGLLNREEAWLPLQELLRLALRETSVQPHALAALQEWLDAEPAGSNGQEQMIRLMTDLVRTGNRRDNERLSYHLRRWAENTRHPSPGAAAALGRLATIEQE